MNPSPTSAQITLLEGSRDFFPALIQAMDGARHEIHLETYIFDFHGAAAEVAQALPAEAMASVASAGLAQAWRPRVMGALEGSPAGNTTTIKLQIIRQARAQRTAAVHTSSIKRALL